LSSHRKTSSALHISLSEVNAPYNRERLENEDKINLLLFYIIKKKNTYITIVLTAIKRKRKREKKRKRRKI
jgi:hypothetical protein